MSGYANLPSDREWLNYRLIGLQSQIDESRRAAIAAARVTDTGWVLDAVTSADGWTVTDQRVRRIGKWGTIVIQATRTGAAITVPADGNIANSQIGTVSADWRPTGYAAEGLHSGSTGPMATGYLNGAGSIFLGAVSAGGTLATGQNVQLAGSYIIG